MTTRIATKKQFYTLDEMLDKRVGELGTPKREAFEQELRMSIISDGIKKARKERKLTQTQLGELVGVQKAQISKLERNANSATIDTIMRVFKALNAEVTFSVRLDGQLLEWD